MPHTPTPPAHALEPAPPSTPRYPAHAAPSWGAPIPGATPRQRLAVRSLEHHALHLGVELLCERRRMRRGRRDPRRLLALQREYGRALVSAQVARVALHRTAVAS